MPPKKAGGKAGGKKGKKKGGDANQGDAFQQYLDELFFIAPQARDLQRDANVKKIKAAYSAFQADRDGAVELSQLGDVVRALGFNPTLAQVRLLQPMVEDGDTGTVIVYDKLEKLLVGIMATKELVYTTTTPEGVPQTKSELIHREPESAVMQAFDAVWEATGRKLDQDRVRYVDGEPMREMLGRHGPYGEQFTEEEGSKFKDAYEDRDTGFIREDAFAVLSVE
jgi:hypothetical protein